MQAISFVVRALLDLRSYVTWTKQQASKAAQPASVALVVPVLNEEQAVPELLKHIRSLRPPPDEVMLVDGGSTDRRAPHQLCFWQTVAIFAASKSTAQHFLVLYLQSPRLRCCRTVELLQAQDGITLLQGGKGRARQMNLGAEHAASDHLIFMHADSRCCEDAVNVVRCACVL